MENNYFESKFSYAFKITNENECEFITNKIESNLKSLTDKANVLALFELIKNNLKKIKQGYLYIKNYDGVDPSNFDYSRFTWGKIDNNPYNIIRNNKIIEVNKLMRKEKLKTL